MEFDTLEFLAGLHAEQVPGAAGTAATTPTECERVGENTNRFADWVRRQDVDGVWGWEAPDLSENDRWWARFRFEDLPVVPDGFRFGQFWK